MMGFQKLSSIMVLIIIAIMTIIIIIKILVIHPSIGTC